IIHNRVTRQIITQYKIYREEWDDTYCEIITTSKRDKRSIYLQTVRSSINFDIKQLEQIVASLQVRSLYFTIEDIIQKFQDRPNGTTFFTFAATEIVRMYQLGKLRTSETYATTLRSFMRYREGLDIALYMIDSDLMQRYECYLKSINITPNTISFYMRVIRAIYNRAVYNGLIEQRFPFKYVYTGVAKTMKRAIHVQCIKQMKDLDLRLSPRLEIVRDMFLFSFYTRGMSFIDMAYLRKSDLSNGVLSYRRRKTGQQLHIKWESCMKEIVDKYSITESNYLLPIIKSENIYTARKQYRNTLISYNNKLKKLGQMVGTVAPLTMYVARHSWASAAHSKNIPISIISEGMGHDNEATTQIYLATLDTSIIDKANYSILNLLR
ncbi:MAG: site-specific integrase, partial [Rikenellaceae bacterium]